MNKKLIVPIVCIVLAMGMLSGCTEPEVTNEAPVASFTAPDPVYIDTPVTFTDTSTDDTAVASWSWDFGDEVGTSIVQNPLYTFTAIGDYEVTLTVTDAEGETSTTTSTVTVGYTPPTATFTYDPMVNITVNATTITFTDTTTAGDGEITAWFWDFGDGTNATTQNATNIMYTTIGTYTVTLTITDGNELTATATVEIEVTEATE